jgi:hypothetical protein
MGPLVVWPFGRRGRAVDDRAKGLLEGGGAVIAVLALAGVLATAWSAYASKDEELRVHLVEIAIGILRADPTKEDVAPARAWAMDAIDKYSGLRPFTADERAALVHKPIGGALPADVGLPEWKKTFKGYGKDGFIIIPPEELPDGSTIVPKGFGKDWFVTKEPKDGSDIVPKGFTLPKDLTKPPVK